MDRITVANVPRIVLLDVDLHRQNNNTIQPWNTCNTTSLAMVADYHGARGDGSGRQLEDQFTSLMEAGGFNRFDMESMTAFLAGYAPSLVQPRFTQAQSVQGIIDKLANGIPVIVSGKFTPSWHFIVLTGYNLDTQKFRALDPNGEYWRTGYDVSASQGVEDYSFELIKNMCNDDGRVNTIWAIECPGVASKKQTATTQAHWNLTRDLP